MKPRGSAISTAQIVRAFTAAALLLCGCARPASEAGAAADGSAGAAGGGAAAPDAFLSARLRGALDADLAWRAADLQCEGGARPDGRGIRVSLAGPLADGRRLRLVFGLAAEPGTAAARAVPANVTLIVEGANRVYATLGDDKCSVDALTQQPVGAGAEGDYWVSARGFCIGPAATLDRAERVLLSRFDFRGRIHVDSDVPRPRGGTG